VNKQLLVYEPQTRRAH